MDTETLEELEAKKLAKLLEDNKLGEHLNRIKAISDTLPKPKRKFNWRCLSTEAICPTCNLVLTVNYHYFWDSTRPFTTYSSIRKGYSHVHYKCSCGYEFVTD